MHTVKIHIPLLPDFLSSLSSLARCLAPAPLKLRPSGAIQIRLLLFFTPVLNSLGMKKIRYAIQKVQKSSSFTKQSCSKMALYRWIRTESRWKKTDFSVVVRLISKLATEFRKEDATRRIDWTQWLNGNWLKDVIIIIIIKMPVVFETL